MKINQPPAGEEVQCKRWLGFLGGSMLVVTLTGAPLFSTLDLMKVFIILRLCPVGKSGKRALTEKCFQRLPLRFFTNKTWIRTLHRSGKVSRCLELGHKKI